MCFAFAACFTRHGSYGSSYLPVTTIALFSAPPRSATLAGLTRIADGTGQLSKPPASLSPVFERSETTKSPDAPTGFAEPPLTTTTPPYRDDDIASDPTTLSSIVSMASPVGTAPPPPPPRTPDGPATLLASPDCLPSPLTALTDPTGRLRTPRSQLPPPSGPSPTRTSGRLVSQTRELIASDTHCREIAEDLVRPACTVQDPSHLDPFEVLEFAPVTYARYAPSQN